ncbi:MAG: helix-turn-helix transcriptional regulator [Liquorilactobacillus nagelii]
MHLEQQIKTNREKHHLTQDDLAKSLNSSHQAVSK